MSGKDEKTPAPSAAEETAAMAANDKAAQAKKPDKKTSVDVKSAPKPKPPAEEKVRAPQKPRWERVANLRGPQKPGSGGALLVELAQAAMKSAKENNATANIREHVEGTSDDEGIADGEEDIDADEDPAEPEVPIQAVEIRKRGPQCTYVKNLGVQCARKPNSPDKQGRCSEHRKSATFRPCVITNCKNWCRTFPFVCSKCKGGQVRAVSELRRLQRHRDQLEYIVMHEKLTEDERIQLIAGLCDPSLRHQYKKWIDAA